MRRLVLFAIAIVFVAQSMAQSISGKVADNNGNTLPNASVIIGGSAQGTVTDSDGSFSIKCSAGKIRLVISYLGYETYDEIHTVGKGDNNLGTITLNPKSYMGNEVVVEATRANSRTPMTYETYDVKFLEKNNVLQDIPAMLELTPSFVSTSEGGFGVGATSFRIRGTDPTRVNITMNGIQINDAESQSVFWNNMPDLASSINSLQITRGVGSSTNGTSAFGATMNLLTGSNSQKPYGELTVMGGNFNTIKASITAGTGIMKNGFAIDLRMSKIRSDGYIEGGNVNNNAVMLNAEWHGKNNLLRANILYGKQKTGITWEGCPADMLETNRRYNPAGEYYDANGNRQYYKDQSDNYQQTHVQVLYSHTVKSNLNLNIGLHYTRGDGYYEEYKNDKSFSEYGLPNVVIPNVVVIGDSTFTTSTTIEKTDLIRRKMMSNDFYGGTISAVYKMGKFTNTFGGSGSNYSGQHYGNLLWMQYAGDIGKDYEWYRNKGNKVDFNFYNKIEYAVLKNLSLYADFQHKRIYYKLKGLDSDLMPDGTLKVLNEDLDYKFFNPKGGIFYEISDKMNLYASVALSHKEPTRANIKDAVGDPLKSPKAERLLDYELGYKFNSKIFTGNLNLYYMDYKDQIVPTGEISSTGYEIMTNVADSYRAGIEVAAAVRPHRKITIEANATFSRNKIKNFSYWALTYDENWNEKLEEYHLAESDIAYSPNIIAAGSFNYNIFGNFNVCYTTKYVGKQYFDNTSSEDRSLKAYWVNNLSFDYAIITKYVKEIRFKLQVNNLFNLKYCNNAYGGVWYEQGTEKTWAYYFPQAGITFMGGVSLSF